MRAAHSRWPSAWSPFSRSASPSRRELRAAAGSARSSFAPATGVTRHENGDGSGLRSRRHGHRVDGAGSTRLRSQRSPR
jgi:hypothetical protein